MLMLEDLKKRPNLIQGLGKSIDNDNYQTIVSVGQLYTNNPTKLVKETKQYEILFAESDLAFAGANHGNIMGPLFALEAKTGNHHATLKEYLSIPRTAKTVDPKLIEEELTALAIVISVFYPGILKIKLPTGINEFNNQECEVKNSFGSCFLNILRH
ncbi:hypothetical protein BH10PSE19_BH10PSE19_22040 [soil metagenome]